MELDDFEESSNGNHYGSTTNDMMTPKDSSNHHTNSHSMSLAEFNEYDGGTEKEAKNMETSRSINKENSISNQSKEEKDRILSPEFNPYFIPKEEKKFTSAKELFDDLRKKVGVELRKIANTDPPKKKDPNSKEIDNKKKKSKKKKKRRSFEPPAGIKRMPQYGNQIAASPDLTRVCNLLSGWGDTSAVNEADDDGVTALMLASERGRVDVIDILLKHGANINLKDKYGKTALSRAAARGNTEVLVMLIGANAEVNTIDSYGNTPLHSSVRNGQKNATVQLLNFGGDPKILNKMNQTAFDKAKTPEFKHFVENTYSQKQKDKMKKKAHTANLGESQHVTNNSNMLSVSNPNNPNSSRGVSPIRSRPSTASVKSVELPRIRTPETSERPKSRDVDRPVSRESRDVPSQPIPIVRLPSIIGSSPRDKDQGVSQPQSVSSRSSTQSQSQLKKSSSEKEEEKKKKMEEDKKAGNLLVKDPSRSKVNDMKNKKLELEKKKMEDLEAKKIKKQQELQKKKEEEEKNKIVNLSLNCKNWCSGIFDPTETGNFGPEKTVDGDTNSRWCGHPPEVAWIVLDLAQQREIHQIKIRFERAFASEYQILFSDDDGQSQDQDQIDINDWRVGIAKNDGHEGWCNIKFDTPQQTRFIKFQEIKAAVEGWGVSIFQFDVLGRVGPFKTPKQIQIELEEEQKQKQEEVEQEQTVDVTTNDGVEEKIEKEEKKEDEKEDKNKTENEEDKIEQNGKEENSNGEIEGEVDSIPQNNQIS